MTGERDAWPSGMTRPWMKHWNQCYECPLLVPWTAHWTLTWEKRKIYLQTQSLTASLCSIHHVIKPEDISWFFFSSKSENQAETILTNYKSTQMPNFLLGGLDTVTRWEINFLSMNVNKLLLLCALYNHIYCIKSWQ